MKRTSIPPVLHLCDDTFNTITWLHHNEKTHDVTILLPNQVPRTAYTIPMIVFGVNLSQRCFDFSGEPHACVTKWFVVRDTPYFSAWVYHFIRVWQHYQFIAVRAFEMQRFFPYRIIMHTTNTALDRHTQSFSLDWKTQPNRIGLYQT